MDGLASRRWLAVVTLITAWLTSDATVRAAVTDFRIYSEPINIGDVVAYEAIDDNQHPVESYTWDYKFVGTCNFPWTGNIQTSGPMVDFIEGYAGQHQIRLRVTYLANSAGQQPPTEIIKTITVNQLTGFRIGSGLNTPAANGPGNIVHLEFVLVCGGDDAGWYIPGAPWEKITNKLVLGNPQPDGDWTGPGAPFYLEGNVIHDLKEQDLGFWNNIGIGQVYYTMTQTMKIVYPIRAAWW